MLEDDVIGRNELDWGDLRHDVVGVDDAPRLVRAAGLVQQLDVGFDERVQAETGRPEGVDVSQCVLLLVERLLEQAEEAQRCIARA